MHGLFDYGCICQFMVILPYLPNFLFIFATLINSKKKDYDTE